MEHIGTILNDFMKEFKECKICHEFWNKNQDICDDCEKEIEEIVAEAEDWQETRAMTPIIDWNTRGL